MSWLKHIFSTLCVFIENVRWKIAGRFVYLNFRYIQFLETINRRFDINGEMAKHGTLFMSFGILLFALKEPVTLTQSQIVDFSLLWRLIPISLILIGYILITIYWKKLISTRFFNNKNRKLLFFSLYAVLFVILLCFLNPLIPFIPIIATQLIGGFFLFISLTFIFAVFIKYIAKFMIKTLEKIQVYYWMIVWFVYIFGWLSGMRNLEVNSIPQYILGIFGFIWFIVLMIVMLRAAWLTGKRI